MPIQVIYITAGLLLLSVLPMPYGYYTFLRIVATGAFAWGAIESYKTNSNSPITWIYVLVAIIFNPIIPVHLSKSIWLPIDISSAILLLSTQKVTRIK